MRYFSAFYASREAVSGLRWVSSGGERSASMETRRDEDWGGEDGRGLGSESATRDLGFHQPPRLETEGDTNEHSWLSLTVGPRNYLGPCVIESTGS
jgi:hypothetical protein